MATPGEGPYVKHKHLLVGFQYVGESGNGYERRIELEVSKAPRLRTAGAVLSGFTKKPAVAMDKLK